LCVQLPELSSWCSFFGSRSKQLDALDVKAQQQLDTAIVNQQYPKPLVHVVACVFQLMVSEVGFATAASSSQFQVFA
jgi:hypothetical protein